MFCMHALLSTVCASNHAHAAVVGWWLEVAIRYPLLLCVPWSGMMMDPHCGCVRCCVLCVLTLCLVCTQTPSSIQAFRKALAEAKEKSQEDALEAMSEQSKKAIQLNRELSAELQTQSRGIRKMCEHFDIRDTELKAVKLQSRLNQSQIKATTAELTRLARHIQQQKREMEEKDAAVQAAEDARVAAEAKADQLQEQVDKHKATIAEKDTCVCVCVWCQCP